MNKVELWKPPQLALAHPSLFTKLELDLYEREILANPKATELDASKFFARYPKFLFLGVGKEIRREVVLINTSSGEIYRVDFFRKKYGSNYWDIIELKTPKASFITEPQKGHPKFSAKVDNAINQALDYRDLLIKDAQLRSELIKRGILISYPQILVVVGKHNKPVPLETMQLLYDRARQCPIEVKSYDDIFEFAKEFYEDCNAIVMPSQIGDSREELSEDVIHYKEVEEAVEEVVAAERERTKLNDLSLIIQQFDYSKWIVDLDCILNANGIAKITEAMRREATQAAKLNEAMLQSARETAKLVENARNSVFQMAEFYGRIGEDMRSQLASLVPFLQSITVNFKPFLDSIPKPPYNPPK